MHLTRLTLTNFRNYPSQTLDLAPCSVLLIGPNAQGKTNILEAIFLLATGRSERATTDADFIAWSALDDPQPVARIVGEAARTSGDITVELNIVGRPRTGAAHGIVASKRFRLNGVARRAADVFGAVTAVLFTTDDMDLVKGAPAGRRRFLDVMLSQTDRAYTRALSRYNKVVTQRNALLKQIQERSAAGPAELSYWDEEMAKEAATLLTARAAAVLHVSEAAADVHARLSGNRERFELEYRPRFVEGWPPERIAAARPDEVATALTARLEATRTRDIAAGITLIGPHRDDLSMTLGATQLSAPRDEDDAPDSDDDPATEQRSAGAFASRGQQRTAALALRLAEATYLHAATNERPILLLDDVLSELDESRRHSVLAAIDADQTLITSPDPDRFSPEFAAGAQLWRITNGRAQRE
jgi:DNA replication and repair protein RecF